MRRPNIFKKSDIKVFFCKTLGYGLDLGGKSKNDGGMLLVYDQFLFQIRNDINRKTICFLIGQLLFITELDQKDLARKFHGRRAHMDYVLGSKCSTIPSFHLYPLFLRSSSTIFYTFFMFAGLGQNIG